MDEKAVIEDQVVEPVVIDETEETVEENNESDNDEVIVSIGEEAPPPEQTPAPDWVKELRKSHRELQRENRELQARLKTNVQTETVELGQKPTLEGFEYDAEKYEVELAKWFEKKRTVDEVKAKRETEVMNQQREWETKLSDYGKAKAELKVKDYEDAEEVVQQSLNVTQQGIVLQGADNPALVIYALGKNPKKAKELSEIKDPVKFAFSVAKLEKELKVTNRKAAQPPETVVTGTARSSGAIDSTLERLRSEAEKTGNYTKVIQYKQKRAASK